RAILGALAGARDGSAGLDLPGGRAVREYAVLRIEGHDRAAPEPAEEQRLTTARPVAWAGWTITLGTAAPDGAQLKAPAPATGDLVVRSRRPGDRLAGRRRIKVQDLFTDAKVPLLARASHPLVATGRGEIWWVVGLKHAEGAAEPGRWIFALPPQAQIAALRRYTGNIDRASA
ncbi:MAG: tRNA lysidine(34) synthetase TilS, partial [Candidatus Limnocylindria bacterium]